MKIATHPRIRFTAIASKCEDFMNEKNGGRYLSGSFRRKDKNSLIESFHLVTLSVKRKHETDGMFFLYVVQMYYCVYVCVIILRHYQCPARNYATLQDILSRNLCHKHNRPLAFDVAGPECLQSSLLTSKFKPDVTYRDAREKTSLFYYLWIIRY